MRDFTELQVWQKAHALTLAVYEVTARFSRDELYGLTGQIRRASVSIPANIAEGCGKDGASELRRYLQIGRASASELQYHLLLARDLGFLTAEQHDRMSHDVAEVKRLLTSFIQRLSSPHERAHKEIMTADG